MENNFLLERMKGIGGSDVAAIMGKSKFEKATPLNVYLRLAEGIMEDDREQSEAQWWGSQEEPLIKKRYEMKTGYQCKTNLPMFVHPKYQFMIGHVDGLATVDGEVIIVEFKTAHQFCFDEWGEPGTDEIPEYYKLQLIHYAAILDKNRVDLAVKIGSSDFRIYTYHRIKSLENKVIDYERYFWEEHIQKKIPPAAQNSEDLKRLYPLSDDEKVAIATPEILCLCDKLNQIKKQTKSIDKEKSELEIAIKDHMKDAAILNDMNGNKIATWKVQNRKGYEVKPSSFRAFRLNGE